MCHFSGISSSYQNEVASKYFGHCGVDLAFFSLGLLF